MAVRLCDVASLLRSGSWAAEPWTGVCGIFLKLCRLLLFKHVAGVLRPYQTLELLIWHTNFSSIQPMTVWPSLGLKAHGDLNHSGVRSSRTMLLSLTFSILNEDLVQTQRKRVDKLSLKKKNTKNKSFGMV